MIVTTLTAVLLGWQLLALPSAATNCDSIPGFCPRRPPLAVLGPRALLFVRPARPTFLAPLPPALGAVETLRYRLSVGPLASVGQVVLELGDERMEGGARLLKVMGRGEGSLLGLGHLARTVQADFDTTTLAPRRWTMERVGPKRTTRTNMDQPTPGAVTVRWQALDTGETDEDRPTFDAAAHDPFGFLLRLRAQPPAEGETVKLRVFDGAKLWVVTVRGRGPQDLPGRDPAVPALRFEGRAEPVFYDGRPDLDGDRDPRDFLLWLADDERRTPLRLSAQAGGIEAVADLVESRRRARPPLGVAAAR